MCSLTHEGAASGVHRLLRPDAPQATKAPKGNLSTLHPSSILQSNPDPNAHPTRSLVHSLCSWLRVLPFAALLM